MNGSKADRFWKRLGQINPLYYLTMYLAFVPIYAAAYRVLTPNGFYAASVRYEPTWATETGTVQKILEDALRNRDSRLPQTISRWVAASVALEDAFDRLSARRQQLPLRDPFGDDLRSTDGQLVFPSHRGAGLIWELKEMRVSNVATDGRSLTFTILVPNRFGADQKAKLDAIGEVLEQHPEWQAHLPPSPSAQDFTPEEMSTIRAHYRTFRPFYDIIDSETSVDAFYMSLTIPDERSESVANATIKETRPVAITRDRTLSKELLNDDGKLFEQQVLTSINDSVSLWLFADERQFIRLYISEYNGLASRVGGSYFRMVYLSAVIVTTLGLGDIVPITDSARLLVALEAVSGIVFIGLFLNAVSFRASRPP